jgi:flagellar M-ring protein FliF
VAKLDPSAMLSELVESYVRLPLFQKIIYPIVIIGCVAGIVLVSRWAHSPDYTLLYSDLSPADSAAVVQRLKEQKIAYEIRGDGTAIAISPPEMVYELRLSMASEGIPKGGTVGLEIFDSSNLGTTTFQEKVKFIRAIQGELERTISSLENVQSARVAITQPEKTIFAKKASEPTASVLLMLRPGAELSKKQVEGISNLVAGSVEGLKTENVKIVDVNGTLLTPSEEDEEGLEGEATRLTYKKEVEQSYINRIEQMLARVVGPEKVVARVTADIDFSLNEREEEVFDPGSQVVRSERSIEEGLGSSQRGGVPGVVSNLSDDPKLLAPPGDEAANSNRKEVVKNFEVSRAHTKVSHARGKLQKLSVAVLVDGQYKKPEGAAADAPEEFVPLDSEVMARIEALVKNAVGYDSARGDSITVENIPFFIPKDNFTEVMEGKATQDLIFNGLFRAGPVLFIIMFFLFLVRPLVKFLVTPTDAEVDLARLLPTGIKELEQELEAERSKVKVPDVEPAVDLNQLNELISENSKVVQQNPMQAALLIRYWLNDGRM